MAIIDDLTCSKSLRNSSQNTEIINRFTRSRWLFGESFEKLQNAKVLVCGCGGVGGATIECLYRSGVINLSVIDCDKFDITNQNRQFGSENLGEKKCEVFAKKFDGVTPIFAKIDDEFLEKFDISKFDFVIDAVDDIRAKIALAVKCSEKNIKFISSLGAAKRLNPSKIKITSIWKTHSDPFARKFRYELKKSGFKGDFPCVFSEEEPNCKKLGSFMGVTASFGLFIASFVVRNLIEK
nr:tRNA threonylcarbamoyladenosine dehydratase [Campylobacter sp. CS_ED1]